MGFRVKQTCVQTIGLTSMNLTFLLCIKGVNNDYFTRLLCGLIKISTVPSNIERSL